MTKKLIHQLEALSLNALPAIQTMYVDGFMLRFAKGYTKRANSIIVPTGVTIENLTANIHAFELLYEKVDVQPTFKVFALDEMDNIDVELAKMNYDKMDEVFVQIAQLNSLQPVKIDDVKVIVTKQLSDVWLRSIVEFKQMNDTDKQTFKEILQLIMPETAYVMLQDSSNGEIIACGLGVLEREYLGLYDIITNPNYRKQGYGKEVVKHLLNWGYDNNAKFAYLQVAQSNTIAIKIYEKLGFKTVYEYWFRIKNNTHF